MYLEDQEQHGPSKRKVSIYDIAKQAGVSPGTVSRVMNNRDRVKGTTRQRVLHAAKEAGFLPQVAIRKPEVAIITESGFSDRITGYSATIVQHLSFELTRSNYDIQVPEEAVSSLEDAYFNGMIVVSHGPSVGDVIAKLEKRIPTVHVDLFQDVESSYSVCSDHEQAGYLAACHFAETGRKRPSFLGMRCPPNTARLSGFRRGLEQYGLSPGPSLTYLREGEDEAFYIGINHLVRSGTDAIYVPGSSFDAMEALHILCYVMKIDVPGKIAVIGGENERISSLLIPPLTTIEEPHKELARKTVSLLEVLLAGKKPKSPREVLPVRLIRRVSGG